MTNEKAIELLHRLQDEQFDGEYGDERREALEMAVRALEGDGDTISRKMAIDAIEEMQMPIMRSEFSEEQFVFTGMAQALQAIKDLPSAQPQRKKGKWIPVDSYSAFGGDEATWMAHGNPVAFYYCSECKEQAYAGEDGESLLTAYCPNCGAYMRGEQDE